MEEKKKKENLLARAEEGQAERLILTDCLVYQT